MPSASAVEAATSPTAVARAWRVAAQARRRWKTEAASIRAPAFQFPTANNEAGNPPRHKSVQIPPWAP